MTQYGFFTDNTRCGGCKTCMIACKDYKDLDLNMSLRKVYNYEGGSCETTDGVVTKCDAYSYYLSVACNHCVTPACVTSCPVSAIEKDEDTGLVVIVDDLCIGCGTCVTACPYLVPKLDEELMLAKKCDGCIDRVKEGKQTVCVEACPLMVLDFGDIDELRSKYGDLAQIPPLPDPKQTAPNLVIKPSPAANSPAVSSGFITNELEVA